MISVSIKSTNSLLVDICVIASSIVILLFGMYLVNQIFTSELASYIDVIPMGLALLFAMKSLRLDSLIGQNAKVTFIIFTIILTLVILLFSSTYVFSPNGYFHTLQNYISLNEQSWAYDNITAISEMSYSDIVKGNLESLQLRKYQNSFLYCSLLFRYGGNVLTHICIWRAFHLCLEAILMALIAARLGVRDRKALLAILIICMIQPMLDVFFAYNHDAVGNFFIALGMYIFVCTSKNKMYSILAFPIYALLFYWFRQPYGLIAIAIFIWNIVANQRSTFSFVFGSLAVILMLIFFITTFDVASFLFDDLGVGEQADAVEREGRGLINTILVGTLGYFPWLNLLKDPNWAYCLFACFQGAMNLSMLYYVYKQNRDNIKGVFSNPVFLAALMFLLSAYALPGHMAYTAVAMPFFAATFHSIKLKSFMKSYVMMIVVVFVAGFIYGTLGFAG